MTLVGDYLRARPPGHSPDPNTGIMPTHVPMKTLDNRQLMAMFKKDISGSGGMFGGGWQGNLMQGNYRTGPGRLRRLTNSYGGTDDSVSWVFSAVSLIASTLGSYPWRFTDAQGETVENPPDDLVKLLEYPNPDWTYFDLVEAVVTDLELVGNAYILKNEMNGLGQPKTLMRLDPSLVRIVAGQDGTLRGYVYTPREQAMAIPYDADEIMHFKYPNPLDPHYGMGTVEAIASVLDRNVAEGLHITGFFQNGARISGVLTIPDTLSETQFERLKQSYNENYAGPANAYKVLIAEGVADYKPITQGPVAAGVVDLMKMSKDEILAAFGIPAPLLGGMMENANYKMEESQHIFLRAMIPRARRFAERLTVDVVRLWSGLDFRIDPHANEPMDVRIAHAKEMLGAGATVNQALEAMGLPPSDDVMAEKILIPSNLITLDIVGLPPRPARSMPMDTIGEAGAPAPGQAALPPGTTEASTSLQDHLADLPAQLASGKLTVQQMSKAIAEAIAGAAARASHSKPSGEGDDDDEEDHREQKYSADQPRDDHGRFAGGGGDAQAPTDADGNALADLNGTPVAVNADGTVSLYHATSEESAQALANGASWQSHEGDEVYFSNQPRGGEGFGTHVVQVNAPPDITHLTDAFHTGEVHVMVHSSDLQPSYVQGYGPSGGNDSAHPGRQGFALTHFASKSKAKPVKPGPWDQIPSLVHRIEHAPKPKKSVKYSPDQPRDDHGRFAGGGGSDAGSSDGGGAVSPITAAEARGNSRAVSNEEFQALAAQGQTKLQAMAAAAAPTTGLDTHFENLKTSTYAAVQEPWGGATIDAHTGEALASNANMYALTVKPPGISTVTVPMNASQEDFSAAMDTAKAQFGGELTQGSRYLGVFRDDSMNNIQIDPVIVVPTINDVETIGAYTHAVGGAYNFADGNGYWPPHVAEGKAVRHRSALAAVDELAKAWGSPKRKAWVPPTLPRGFETLSATAELTTSAQQVRDHQAVVLRHGVDAFEPVLRKFFHEQHERVLASLAQFGGGQRAARLAGRPTRSKKDLTPDGIFDMATENAALVAAYLPVLDEVGATALAPDAPGVMGQVSWDLQNPNIARIRAGMAQKVTRVNETTKQAIADQVVEGLRHGYSIPQIANGFPDENYPGIKSVFTQASTYRAEMIARSESAMAFGGASVASFEDAGITHVQILDGTDFDEACADANGQTWTLQEYEDNLIEHPNCSRAATAADDSDIPGGD